MSEFTVHIEEAWESYRLKFYVFERFGDGGGRIHLPTVPGTFAPTTRLIKPNQAIAEEDRIPLLELPREAAHPLLAALARQLGAVEHPEQLRKDFEHEQRRVDMFINATLEQLGILKARL